MCCRWTAPPPSPPHRALELQGQAVQQRGERCTLAQLSLDDYGGLPCQSQSSRGFCCDYHRSLVDRQPAVASCLVDDLCTCRCCSALGEVYGVPKVHYKGQQADFYVMVSEANPLSECKGACRCLVMSTRCCALPGGAVLWHGFAHYKPPWEHGGRALQVGGMPSPATSCPAVRRRGL